MYVCLNIQARIFNNEHRYRYRYRYRHRDKDIDIEIDVDGRKAAVGTWTLARTA